MLSLLLTPVMFVPELANEASTAAVLAFFFPEELLEDWVVRPDEDKEPLKDSEPVESDVTPDELPDELNSTAFLPPDDAEELTLVILEPLEYATLLREFEVPDDADEPAMLTRVPDASYLSPMLDTEPR